VDRKWLKILTTVAGIAGCLAFAFWMVIQAMGRPRAMDPNKPTEFELTCVDENCPGRHRDPDNGETVPFTVRRMLPAGCTDWPRECPECGQKSLYRVMTCPMCAQLHRKRVEWRVLNASDPAQYKCPECGFSPYE